MKTRIRILALLLCIVLISSSCTSKHQTNNEREAYGKNGMVATANKEASAIGMDILKSGGNAIDAAVAVGFALGALEPNASGIGGGGFLLYKPAGGESVFLDFREVTPQNGNISQYEVNEDFTVKYAEDIIGPKSIAIPGEVKGLLTALDKYGTMNRQEVIEPAIKLARDGVQVSKTLAEIAQNSFSVISGYENTLNIYSNDGFPLAEGDIIKNPELANTLEQIASKGESYFYNSNFTEEMVKELNSLGSYIQVEDFNNYNVEFLEPLTGTYRGYDIITSPPPSSGGVHIIEILNMLENYDLSEIDPSSTLNLHLWSEVYKRAFWDRNAYMGDPKFTDVPVVGLLNKNYAVERIKSIDVNSSTDLEILVDPWKFESGSTTHYSIIDKEGNMVSVTKTINHFFGSGVTVKGVLFNDQIADLSFDSSSPNKIEPFKKPLSSMSPTILIKDGKPFATLGTPGGVRIITTIPWLISLMIDHNMNIQEAIDYPRVSQIASGPLEVENRFDSYTLEQLEKMGHAINVRSEKDLYFGGAQGIQILDDGYYHGGADDRRDGHALGY